MEKDILKEFLTLNKTNFYDKIKESTKVYSNYNLILDKAENDDYLSLFFESISYIFQKEMSFTVEELGKMPDSEKIDIKHFLKKNIYIFKENLKLILMSSVDELWKLFTEKEKVDNFLMKSNLKKKFDVIDEVEEENISEDSKKNSNFNNLDSLDIAQSQSEKTESEDYDKDSMSLEQIILKNKKKISFDNEDDNKINFEPEKILKKSFFKVKNKKTYLNKFKEGNIKFPITSRERKTNSFRKKTSSQKRRRKNNKSLNFNKIYEKINQMKKNKTTNSFKKSFKKKKSNDGTKNQINININIGEKNNQELQKTSEILTKKRKKKIYSLGLSRKSNQKYPILFKEMNSKKFEQKNLTFKSKTTENFF